AVAAGLFDRVGAAASALALQSLKVLRHLVVELGRVFVEQLFEALVLPRDLAGRVEAARVFVDGLELDAVIHVLRRVEVLFLLFLFLFFLVLPPSEQAALFFVFVFSAFLLSVSLPSCPLGLAPPSCCPLSLLRSACARAGPALPPRRGPAPPGAAVAWRGRASRVGPAGPLPSPPPSLCAIPVRIPFLASSLT